MCAGRVQTLGGCFFKVCVLDLIVGFVGVVEGKQGFGEVQGSLTGLQV